MTAFSDALQELDQLQDSIEYRDCKPRWKSLVARWQRRLNALEEVGDLSALWELALEFVEHIKPDSFKPEWSTRAPRFAATLATDVTAVINAIRMLRGCLAVPLRGPSYDVDGIPIAMEGSGARGAGGGSAPSAASASANRPDVGPHTAQARTTAAR